jgi:protease PrsW
VTGPLSTHGVPQPDHGPVAPLVPPRARLAPGAGAVVVLVALAVLGIAAVGLIGFVVGPDAFVVAAVLAMIPLAVVLAAVLWVDRWEPEPWSALAVAFGWGASVSVLVALVLNSAALVVLLELGSDAVTAGAWAATVVAPVVEESIKGLGLLLIFLVWRRFYDGPVDGVVYAATVAAGFAFVENILYFGEAVGESAVVGDGGSVVAVVFVLRAVASPFAHVLFTACIGLALGWAARSRSGSAWVVAFPLGLVAAIGLHALWNGTASFGGGGLFLLTYLLFQVPFFLGAIGLVLWLRRQEARIVRDRLAEYATAWWFSPQEVQMLGSLAARRQARRWAGARGGRSAVRQMRRFQLVATRLAYQRHRMLIRRAALTSARQDEAALLAELERVRAELRSLLAV